MRVTLEDIAKRSAVSVATVSRVLNNHPHVHAATRATVWNAARELCYPGGRLSTTQTVLLLTHDEIANAPQTASFEQLAFRGARAVFQQHGFDICVQQVRPDQAWLEDDGTAAGLLLLGGTFNQRLIRQLLAAKRPLVVVGAHAKPLAADCVMADVADGVEQAVSHLVARGRSRLGLVNGPDSTTSSRDKLQGFRLALERANLPFAAAQVAAGAFSAEAGYAQTRCLLEQFPEVDALLYAADLMAIGGLRALREAGRRVPRDVAVVGFHDFDLARFTEPPLTSVHLDMSTLGKMAAQRLLVMLEQPSDTPQLTLIPTRLIVRASS